MSKQTERSPSRKELLKMPRRKWDDTSREYDQILLVPASTKHDSGYMHIAVIGVYKENEEVKYEIAAYPDDISCLFKTIKFGDKNQFEFARVRMDCLYPSGVLRYHAGEGHFTVGAALSSVDILFHDEK